MLCTGTTITIRYGTGMMTGLIVVTLDFENEITLYSFYFLVLLLEFTTMLDVL